MDGSHTSDVAKRIIESRKISPDSEGTVAGKIIQKEAEKKKLEARSKIYQEFEGSIKQDIKNFFKAIHQTPSADIALEKEKLKNVIAPQISVMLRRLGLPKEILCQYNKDKGFLLLLPPGQEITGKKFDGDFTKGLDRLQEMIKKVTQRSFALTQEELQDELKILHDMMGGVLSNLNENIDSLGIDNEIISQVEKLEDQKRGLSEEKKMGITILTLSLVVECSIAICMGIALALLPGLPVVLIALAIAGIILTSFYTAYGAVVIDDATHDKRDLNSQINDLVSEAGFVSQIPLTEELLDPVAQSLLSNLALDSEIMQRQQQAAITL